MNTIPSLKDLRRLYAENVNIMGWFREVTGQRENSTESILISYDLQSGSYTRAADDPAYRARHDRYADEIAAVLGGLGAASVLEAGVGEATTLVPVMQRLQPRPAVIAGFDISWSRILFARRYCAAHGLTDARLCTGDLFAMPFVDDAFEVVFTAHAIEPNHGREREALLELYRVARRWVVLFEPSYELGSEATRQRVEEHGYCRGLPAIAQELGWKIAEHRLLANPMRDNNQTAVLVIEKPAAVAATPAAGFGCPLCHRPLESIRGNYFCEDCARIFPVIDDIPCLLPGNGILGSKFKD